MVIDIIAASLERPVADIHTDCSLIDDLGAESIDFLDISHRVESVFRIRNLGNRLWEGSLRLENTGYVTEEGVTEEGLLLLKERMPDFPWERFPSGVSRQNLPRLVTVQTIIDSLVDYFEKEGPVGLP